MNGQGSLFNSDTSGVNLMYMWFGQIVDESTWVENLARKDGKHSLRSRDDFQGYGYRYKVRIFGRDLEDKVLGTPDEELYMAEVSLPVTSGSGHGGSVQTPNLRQGNYVFGFYKDGIEATEPIIFGLLPNYSQTRLFGGDPDKGFFSRTGFSGKYGSDNVSNKNILSEGPDKGNAASESISSNYVLDIRDVDILSEQRDHYVPKTYDCDSKEGGSLKAVQKIIKELQGVINKLKSFANTFAGAVTDITNGINSLLEDAAILVTDIMKGVIDKMRGFAENLLNKGLMKVQSILPPNLTPLANEKSQIVVDILACLFNKIIKQLFKAVSRLLSKLLGKAMNTAQCVVENFMGSLLSGILGPLASTLSKIGDFLGSIVDTVGSVLDGIFNGLNAILGIIKFLTCDESPDCSAGDSWNFAYGDTNPRIKIPNLKNIIKNNAFSGGRSPGSSGCNIKPTLASSPKVKFSGGGGTGAIGNAIISPSGKILGVDIISGGTGFTSPPTVTLDNNGPGSGTVLFARLANDRSFLGGVGGSTSRIPNENNLSEIDSETRSSPLKINSSANSETFSVNPILAPTNSSNFGDANPLTFSDTQINVGGSGGIPITIGGSGGNPLTFNNNPVTISQSPLSVGGNGQPVITESGPLVLGGQGGTPVKVGGNGGTELLVNKSPINAIVDVPLFDNVENLLILDGPFIGEFNGRGAYNNGKFTGNGILTGETDEGESFSLSGSFSGFNTLLTGFGQGSFKGMGEVINGRFIGEGIFTSDSKNKSKLLSEVKIIVDDLGRNITTLSDGTRIESNNDGTGSITTPNNKKTAVSFVKVGATSGSPVTVNNVPVTLDGQLVTVGGNGGTLLRVDLNNKDNIASSGGFPVQVSGLNVSNKNSGLPIVAGADSNNSPALSNGILLTSKAGIIRSPIDLGSANENVSVKGDFSGPDGSPVEEVIVIDPGVGYLPFPDGSIYADGVKFSDANQTIIFDENSGFNVYPPNTTVQVLSNNEIYLPSGAESFVYSTDGVELQRITGLGQETAIPIKNNGVITTPTYNDEENELLGPVSGDGSYSVILEISDILIANPGFNYSKDDKIIMQPSNGAELIPKFDEFGRVETVTIANPGIGFTDTPNIFIQSNTGLNSVLIPIFGSKRIGSDAIDQLQEQILPEDASFIEIIDCVGKISRRK